jgi:hypothetical protein
MPPSSGTVSRWAPKGARDVGAIDGFLSVVIMSNMTARELVRRRVAVAENAFADLVVWQVSRPLPGSVHNFKYRLAFVVKGVCVLRYDNEAGKGDHRHVGDAEWPYAFSTPRQLLADFFAAVTRWRLEHSDD